MRSMSMVRLVSRIIPTYREQNISHLLAAKDIDSPSRGNINCSGDQNSKNFVVYETTFCKEKTLPPGADLDSTIAARCDSTPGLINLKKSRLRLTTESSECVTPDEMPSDPVIRVSPENLGDGTCAGILVSIPLRLSKREVVDQTGKSTVYFTAGHGDGSECDPPLLSHVAAPRNHAIRHGRKKRFVCDGRGRSERHRSGRGSFRCDACEQVFVSRSKLSKHKRTHETAEP